MKRRGTHGAQQIKLNSFGLSSEFRYSRKNPAHAYGIELASPFLETCRVVKGPERGLYIHAGPP